MINIWSNNKDKKKCGFISVIKFIFCSLIILMHWNIPSDFSKYMFEGGYICVDFFFILQGFFLIRNWDKEDSYIVTRDYLLNRVKRFFPTVLFASTIMFIIQIFDCVSIKNVERFIIEFISQISFGSQLFSFMSLGAGGIFWFLSASIVGGTIIICLCKVLGKKIVFFIPFITAIMYNYIYKTAGNLDVWHTTIFYGILKISLVRAFAGIFIGVFANIICDIIKKVKFKIGVCVVFRLMNIILVMFTIYNIIYSPHTVVDFYEVAIFAMILILSYNFFGLNSNIITNYMDILCMPMYIFQVICILLLSKFMYAGWISGLILIMFDVIISSCWLLIFPIICKLKKLIIVE